MTTREIQAHLQEIYAVEVSPTLISEVTDAVWEEVQAWQSRPLDPVYPIVYLDALFVKMRHEGRVGNRAVYVAIGIGMDGRKEVLGLWVGDTEGAKFWLGIVTELRHRGVQDIFIACVDGLKGFPEAIETVFAKTQVQLCVVHLIRNSLKFVNWKDRKHIIADLRAIYSAPQCRSRSGRTHSVRPKMGHAIQSDSNDVGTELGARRSVLVVCTGNSKDHLLHQCGRIPEYEFPENHQNARIVSKRGSCIKAALPGGAKRDCPMGLTPPIGRPRSTNSLFSGAIACIHQSHLDKVTGRPTALSFGGMRRSIGPIK